MTLSRLIFFEKRDEEFHKGTHRPESSSVDCVLHSLLISHHVFIQSSQGRTRINKVVAIACHLENGVLGQSQMKEVRNRSEALQIFPLAD